MAQALRELHLGPESHRQLRRKAWPGAEHTPLHQFLDQVRARDANGKLLPEISAHAGKA